MKLGTIVEVETNLPDATNRLSLDEEALTHIMGILTELYEDPELAIIREYSTNAWDSHQEAGQSLPIEVTLPSPLEPDFVVTDQGIGMSRDTVENVFTKYGASTKRDSNDVVGCLGLGCKSALAHADQFTLVARKDGREVTVMISRTDDGGADMRVLRDEATTESDGVTVRIPTRRSAEFAKKAQDFFRFWPRGSVLVNGEEPTPLVEHEDAQEFGPGLYIVPGGGPEYDYETSTVKAPDDYVVMGNVPYPVNRSVIDPKTPERLTDQAAHAVRRGDASAWNKDDPFPLANNFKVVKFVEIGDVDVAPARESLRLTKRTKDALEAIGQEVRRLATSYLQDQVNAATTKAEVMEIVRGKTEFLLAEFRQATTLTWKGQDLPMKVPLPTFAEVVRVDRDGGTWDRGYYAMNQQAMQGSWDEFDRLIVVTGWTNTTNSKQQRRKIIRYAQSKGFTLPDSVSRRWSNNGLRIGFLAGGWSWSWAPKGHVVKWDDVKAWDDPNQSTTPATPATTSYGVTSSMGLVPTITPGQRPDRYGTGFGRHRDVDAFTGEEWYVERPPRLGNEEGRAYVRRIHDLASRYALTIGKADWTVAFVQRNRVKAWRERHPKSKDLEALATALDVRRWNRATQEERDHLWAANYMWDVRPSQDSGWRPLVEGVQAIPDLDPARVDDPDLRYAMTVMAATPPTLVRELDPRDSLLALLEAPKAKERDVDEGDRFNFEWAAHTYPLLHPELVDLDEVTDAVRDHLTTYVNAAYAAGR